MFMSLFLFFHIPSALYSRLQTQITARPVIISRAQTFPTNTDVVSLAAAASEAHISCHKTSATRDITSLGYDYATLPQQARWKQNSLCFSVKRGPLWITGSLQPNHSTGFLGGASQRVPHIDTVSCSAI